MSQDTLIIAVIALVIVVGSCLALGRAGRKNNADRIDE